MMEERRALLALVKRLRDAMEYHEDGTHRQAVYVPQEDLATLLDEIERGPQAAELDAFYRVIAALGWEIEKLRLEVDLHHSAIDKLPASIREGVLAWIGHERLRARERKRAGQSLTTDSGHG